MSDSREMLVFVYGTLQEGGRLHDRLGDCRTQYVGVGRILNKEFVMRDLTGFPALEEVQRGSGTYIKGELYLIDGEMLSLLDRIENCPHAYQRKLVDVWVDSKPFRAHVYYMNREKTSTKLLLGHSPVIPSGEWDAVKNRSVPGNAGMAETAGKMDDAGKWTWNGDEVSAGDNVHSSYGGYEEENNVDISADFDVEPGVYISNEHGDFWGPFDCIEHACRAMMEIQVDSVTNVLSIGFRMIRKDVTQDVMVDIEAMTNHMDVL